MVKPDYQHIWDCCCDHGFLGISLLSNQAAETIHFVDIVPELVANLENKLRQFHDKALDLEKTPRQFHDKPQSKWKTHCVDVAALLIGKYEGKHLVIIAGVGGDLMTRMIDAIHQRHQHLNIDFLLCPVNRQFIVREKLIALKFGLYDEILIEDKQRFYEILFVSSTPQSNSSISPVGDKIWQAGTTSQTQIIQDYLNKTLNYYQKVRQGNESNVEHIISAYQAVKLSA